MPKYLVQASYSPEGAEGLLKDGGRKRRAAVETAVTALGGSIEAFYFSLGDADVVGIVELPDAVTAAAFSIATNASGAVALTTTPLLSPAEIDEATKKTVNYQPPGE